MRKRPLALLVAALVALVLAGLGSAGRNGNGPTRDHGQGHWFKRACDVGAKATASCDVQVVTDAGGTPQASGSPPATAYGPTQFHTAYNLPTGPSTQTIGIVDAYDDPNIEADLGAYDTQYGLPACTTQNGCFRKVNQTGGTSYPAANSGWALEIALDVETAHEICQTCKILLVEASSNSMANLGTAENEAVALGANAISNSYGSGEYSTETSDETSYFKHSGVMITASSGDGAYGVEFPAASQYVTAVGGTTLNLHADNTYASESAWADAGSGCSAYEPKPSWQSDTGCSRRTVADVSADADPNTGAAVYDSVSYLGQSGWFQVGGTSLASPLIAAVYALTGSAGSTTYGSAPYAHTSSLNDVVGGSNANSCNPTYLCTAVAGYDGPTGLGTPIGTAAFVGGTPSPNFSLGVTPSSQTVTQGSPAGYTVTITPSGGFTDAVTLGASGLPSGATASFTPNPATGSSQLTVTTSASLAPGSYPFTITGVDGQLNLNHQVGATLVVQAAAVPDFSIALTPSSRSIPTTGSTTYTVTITGTNGFNSAVTLTVSGLPSGITGAFSTNPTTSTSTLTLTSNRARKHTHATVTVTGKSGSLTHSASASLSVG